MPTQLILIGDMLVVVEGDLEPPIASSTDVDEGHCPAQDAATDAPRIVFHKPFGWGAAHSRTDAPDSG
jgi:hypothetical protein